MTRFDDVGTGDGRWDDFDSVDDFLGENQEDCPDNKKSEKKEETEEESKTRPACFGLACWKIQETLFRGETVDIPSLGMKIKLVQAKIEEAKKKLGFPA